MKLLHRVELVLAVTSITAIALAAVTACSSSSSSGAASVDAGADGSAAADTSTSNDAGGGDTGQQQLPVTCQNYCSVVTSACIGNNAEYLTNDTCLKMCSNMTLGTQGDMTGDTVACRQAFAEIAAADPMTNCPSAGPTGGDVCGPNRCVSWCELDRDLCGTIAYADEPSCETACAGFPYNANGETVQLTGDTLNCRIYHIEAAYGSPDGSILQETHCAHTSQMSRILDGGPGPCVDPTP
jgi:hypothetical protein